jgi:hypothetical protein
MSYLHWFTVFVIPGGIILSALLAEAPSRWRSRARKEAEEKAIILLQSWLTPEQAEQWATRGDFEVVGCDTGRRYRITNCPAMNILQLGDDEKAVAQWCFMPEGELATGDVLLAQKITLETMERDLLALANTRTQAASFMIRSPVVLRR